MRRLFVLATVLTTLAGVGCNNDSTSPGSSLAGTYTLLSVNATPVPVTVVSNPGYTLDVLAGHISLDAQGNYSGTVTYRQTYTNQAPTQYDDNLAGYWSLSGNQLTLVDVASGTPFPATVSNNTITLIDQSGRTEVYSK